MSGTFVETFWRDIIAKYPTWMLDTVGMFIWHEAIYFGAAIPFIIMDTIPALRKYKIQPNSTNTFGKYVKVVGHVLFSHVMQMMLMAIFHYVAPLCGVRYDGNLESVYVFPTRNWAIARLVVVSFFLEDFWFYWLHRLLHHGVWYKYIHKMHHEYQAPNSLSGEYAHPAETLILGVGTILGPLMMAQHITSVYIWIGIRLLQVVECHSGYDFPWSPRKFIPFWGGAEFHDFHHETFTGNYASTFTIWDHVFGTDNKYRDRKTKRMQEAPKNAKIESKQA